MSFTLAVIGTAFRNDDARRASPALWDAMYGEVLRAIDDMKPDALVSGGAAGGDHAAVRAFNEGKIPRLRLMLPANFVRGRYVAPGQASPRTAETANGLHAAFGRSCGIDPLAELAAALERGAEARVYDGFIRRDREIAKVADAMVAQTFGQGREPQDFRSGDPGYSNPLAAGAKPGGTSKTWSFATGCAIKRHVPLGWLEHKIGLSAAAPAPARDLFSGP